MSPPETDTTALSMASVRPEFARLANRIAGRHRPMQFQWNGQAAEFCFTLEKAAPRGGWHLDVEMGGHALLLELNRLPDVAWVSPNLAGIDLEGLPQELACGLIEACLGEIFDGLTRAGIDVKITSVKPFSLRRTPDEAVEWRVNRGTETGWMRGRVAGDDAALAHLAAVVERAPAVPVFEDVGVPVPVKVIAGEVRLTLVELQAVEVHDVLLADLAAYAQEKQARLWASGRALGAGTLQGGSFTLKTLNPAGPTTMADTAATVNDLEIQLTFVVGEATLTVGDLRTLAPGHVLQLTEPAGLGITICANGKPIGKGELIEVGDRLGVRVTEFNAS